MNLKDYYRAVEIVKGIKTGPQASLCAWQAREAFVNYFANDPNFDADIFRDLCGEIAASYRPPLDQSVLNNKEKVFQLANGQWVAYFSFTGDKTLQKDNGEWQEIVGSPFNSEDEAIRMLIGTRNNK